VLLSIVVARGDAVGAGAGWKKKISFQPPPACVSVTGRPIAAHCRGQAVQQRRPIECQNLERYSAPLSPDTKTSCTIAK